MKKIIIFILIVVLLCFGKFAVASKFTIDEILAEVSAEIYLPYKAKFDGIMCVDNGDGVIIFPKTDQIEYILNHYNVLGYTLKFKNFHMVDFINKIEPNYYYSIDGFLYGYSAKLFEKSISDYNFQALFVGNELLVGVPMLLGSY